MSVKKNAAFFTGRKRPAKGPYPKGVINGPEPTTKRGKARRRENTINIKEGEFEGDTISKGTQKTHI